MAPGHAYGRKQRKFKRKGAFKKRTSKAPRLRYSLGWRGAYSLARRGAAPELKYNLFTIGNINTVLTNYPSTTAYITVPDVYSDAQTLPSNQLNQFFTPTQGSAQFERIGAQVTQRFVDIDMNVRFTNAWPGPVAFGPAGSAGSAAYPKTAANCRCLIVLDKQPNGATSSPIAAVTNVSVLPEDVVNPGSLVTINGPRNFYNRDRYVILYDSTKTVAPISGGLEYKNVYGIPGVPPSTLLGQSKMAHFHKRVMIPEEYQRVTFNGPTATSQVNTNLLLFAIFVDDPAYYTPAITSPTYQVYPYEVNGSLCTRYTDV